MACFLLLFKIFYTDSYGKNRRKKIIKYNNILKLIIGLVCYI